jgi:alkaline phosphatase
MRFKRNLTIMIIAALMMLFVATSALAKTPKFVFFFLGDGMASSQIQATEAYLATTYAIEKNLSIGPKPGELNSAHLLNPYNRLNMTQMPVAGMQTTYDSFALMTDSASSATAFASGIKTRSAVIGMDNTMTTNYKSIAQLAHERGMKVGIISSVPLNHATPASYYASVTNRGLYNDIAAQMVETGYEFFGGGGILSPEGPARSGDTNHNIWNLLADEGYTVLNDRNSIIYLKKKPMDKVVCINRVLDDSEAMPYEIDRPDGNLSLAEMTEVGIAVLQGTKPGKDKGKATGTLNPFFLMVEGGKIDWACHANDAMAAIGDVLDFDDAVGVALEFYKKYPNDTLIVVTGDHETGGMTIGHATTGYKAYYERLLGQKNSYQYFGENQWADHKEASSQSVCASDVTNADDNLLNDPIMLEYLKDKFGMEWTELNDYQKEKLEDAYDKSMCGVNDNSIAENTLLYGGYEPIIVTITHILNEQASIGWTSYSHTGVPVPVFAQGKDAERFAGFYDNTDIARQLAKAIGINEKLPVEK